jgi:hypothetical protein
MTVPVVETQDPVVLRMRRRPPIVLRIMRPLPVVPGIPTAPPAVVMVPRYPQAVPELVIPYHAAEKSETHIGGIFSPRPGSPCIMPRSESVSLVKKMPLMLLSRPA